MALNILKQYNMKDYSKITLGELLSSPDEIIKRNAVSILKRYQNINCGGTCLKCNNQSINYGILNGSYTYTCLNCGKLHKSEVLNTKQVFTS